MADFRAVLFDLDGTLLDTLDDLADSANAMLAEEGFGGHPVPAYRTFVGDGARTLIGRVLPEPAASDPATVDRCLRRYLEIYGENWDRKTRLYPGIEGLLDALQEGGFRLAVLSNKPHDATRKCMERFCGRWDWAAVYGKRDGLPLKPDPAAALRILEELALAPEQVVFLGDTNVDMQTANRAGLRAAGALWGFRDREELERHGAHWLLERPGDLIPFLDGSRDS